MFLYLSHKLVPIQRQYRNYLIQKYIKYSGPGILNRSICTNDTDILTLDNLNSITFYQFFSFTDEDGHTYGFDIKSLTNWLNKQKKGFTNPYNRKNFDGILPLSYSPKDILFLKSTSIGLHSYDG